jgi:glycosyltransferase involved in cell wall biosynthesis
MRVLMISRPCLIGAYQRKLEEIARFSDVELMVAVPPSWREGGRVIQLERAYTTGYRLVVEPLAVNGSFHLHFYPRLRQRLRAFAPEVVHVDEEPYNLATFHAMWLAKRAGAQVLWFSWQNLTRQYPPPFCWFERYAVRNADHAIVGSQGAATVWRGKGYAGPLAVIPQFGVDADIFSPDAVRRQDRGEFVIGYAGRLVREKGVDLLLQAAAGVDGKWQMIVQGMGSEQRQLETLADDLGVRDCISFRGQWMPSLELPQLYRQLDVLVVPTRSLPNWVEQFGRVLVEAMACGVPVIGSDCGEIPNVVGDAGLIFPEDDVGALREQLARLMRDAGLRAELSRRGRERVLNHYTQARIAAQTVDVYREVVGY